MDRKARVLIWVGPTLGRDCDLLLAHGPSCVDHAVLEDRSRVTEDEVHSAIDVAFFVELSLGVDVEGVLEAFEAAEIEG